MHGDQIEECVKIYDTTRNMKFAIDKARSYIAIAIVNYQTLAN